MIKAMTLIAGLTWSHLVYAMLAPLPKVNDRPIVRALRIADYLKSLEPHQIVEKSDSQNKGKPDIFLVYNKKENGGRSLAIQLFDLNRDGKIDLVKFYEKDRLQRTEADLDFDGKADLITEYDTSTGEVRRKTQGDGNTSIWTYYNKRELRKKEIDRNADGKPDLWVYYKNGRSYRTEIDKNFDGKVVKLESEIP